MIGRFLINEFVSRKRMSPDIYGLYIFSYMFMTRPWRSIPITEPLDENKVNSALVYSPAYCIPSDIR